MPQAPISKIRFFFSESKPSLQNRKSLKSFINSIFKKEKKILGSINFIFTNDKIVRKINKEYLGHDFNTDVITFDLSEKNGPISSDIYISTDRVRENARNLKLSYKSELHRVIFHGALHLCGYGDKVGKEVLKMRKMEEKYLNKYFRVSRDTVSV